MFNFMQRQKRLKESMKEAGLDCLIVSDRKDIYYQTGFLPLDGDFAFLIFTTEKRPELFVNPVSNRAESLKTADTCFVKDVKEMVGNAGLSGTIGFDEKSLSVSSFMDISKHLRKHRLKKPCSDLIRSQRAVKDESEISEMGNAVAVTEKILSDARGYMEGKREFNIAKKIEKSMLEKLMERSFETIVASGKNSSLIHYIPGKGLIGQKSLVVIDMGIISNNYCSDMTRTFCLKPGPKEQKLHDNILEVQETLIDRIHEGVRVEEINRIYQEEMAKKGYAVNHGWGHSIGLDVHDPGFKEFRKGMVITVEPGAYIKGFGGCRIEDMILVGKAKSKKMTKMKSSL
ncbi:MAG: aminopeptidase P family protein [Candidatus Aenigmarchaeota archaeon]|nr:aminopeptidase P family protein [Candidatus Aenigmarchaeota archaeon]